MRRELAVIIILAVVLTGCGKGYADPQDAFSAYQYAINTGDYSAIKRLTTENFRIQMVEQGTDLKNISKFFKSAGLKSADCKITFFEQVHPEKATIGCTGIYEYKDGRVEQSYREEYFLLAKEEGAWKVDKYKEVR